MNQTKSLGREASIPRPYEESSLPQQAAAAVGLEHLLGRPLSQEHEPGKTGVLGRSPWEQACALLQGLPQLLILLPVKCLLNMCIAGSWQRDIAATRGYAQAHVGTVTSDPKETCLSGPLSDPRNLEQVRGNLDGCRSCQFPVEIK